MLRHQPEVRMKLRPLIRTETLVAIELIGITAALLCSILL
jgi:hypothetical protein